MLDASKWPVIDEKQRRYELPNGRKLERISIRLPNADSPNQYALVDREKKQFYFVRAQRDGTPGLIQGPAPLPQKPGWPTSRLSAAVKAVLLRPGGLPATPPEAQPIIKRGQPIQTRSGGELIRIPVKLPRADSATQYALLDPKTKAFFFVRAGKDEYDVGLVQGPVKLPGV